MKRQHSRCVVCRKRFQVPLYDNLDVHCIQCDGISIEDAALMALTNRTKRARQEKR